MANAKTNAQRMLEKLGIKYIAHSYSSEDGKIDGVAVANKVGIPAEQVFKTLVTRAASKEIFVFVIPVAMELDLKAAARAVGAKSVEMVQVKELLSKDVDVLVLQPVAEDALAEILPLAGNTPVIVVGTEPEDLGKAYFVGCDKDQQAQAQAELVKQMFAKADINSDRTVKYMLLTGPEEDPETVRYVQNVEEVLASASVSKLQETAVERTVEAGKNACKQALSKYGRDMELIFCGDSALTAGAVEAVKSSGRTPGRDVVIFGVGSLEGCREQVRTGALTVAVVEDISTIRDRIVQTVKGLAGGKDVQQRAYVPHIVLTIENIDDY